MATMTSAANTGSTEMDLILGIVQVELLRTAKLRPTVTDFSAAAGNGIKTIDVPRYDTHFSAPVALNPDGDTVPATDSIVFAVDTITLDQWTTKSYSIPDRVEQQSMIPVAAKLAESAGKTYGNYIDDRIIARLREASATGPDHRTQLGGGGTAITLANIVEARKLLNKAEVEQDGRFLVISPDQEEAMLNITNFIKANEYGSREALLEGEIGKVFGMRVMVHNGLDAAEAFAYHPQAVGIAVQKELKFETDRIPKLQKTDYVFSMGMGDQVLEQGVKQVWLNATGT